MLSFDERYRQQQFPRRNWTLLYGALFLAALVVGLVAGELRRRSGSVWPGAVTHLVHNAMAQVVALAFAGVL